MAELAPIFNGHCILCLCHSVVTDANLYSRSLPFSKAPAFWKYISKYTIPLGAANLVHQLAGTFQIPPWLVVFRQRLFIPGTRSRLPEFAPSCRQGSGP